MDIELLPFSTETNIASNLIRKFGMPTAIMNKAQKIL